MDSWSYSLHKEIHDVLIGEVAPGSASCSHLIGLCAEQAHVVWAASIGGAKATERANALAGQEGLCSCKAEKAQRKYCANSLQKKIYLIWKTLTKYLKEAACRVY